MANIKKSRVGVLEFAVCVVTTLILVGVMTALVADLRPEIGAFFSGEAVADQDAPKQIAAEQLPNPDGTTEHGEAQEPPITSTIRVPQTATASNWFAGDFLGKTILGIAAVLALLVAASLTFVYCLLGLLRRHGAQFGPLIRIEYAGASSMVVGPIPASVQSVAAMPQHVVSESPSRPIEFAATPQVDDDSSYDAERKLREVQDKRMQQAMLQQLFDNNLKLQGQIGLAQDA